MTDHRRNVYFFHKQDNETKEQVSSLKQLAESNGFTVVSQSADANIIASVGGDGSFLQAVRKTNFREDCLYVGIAKKGKAHLYCDFNSDETEKMTDAMKFEQIEVRKYPLIHVKVDDTNQFHCLNEVSIRSSIIKTFVMDVLIDDLHFETFRGDGMIISTPTGSTAYNKSVAGAVVDPLLSCMQVTELASLNNNTYRTLGSPFVLSSDRKLTLNIVQDGNEHPIIGLDNEALSTMNVKKIEITLSEKKIKTVKLKDNSFWEKVKRSFL
ncbi:NAD kinase [Bacillus atrophaeus]|uniref:NAD kinase n=1 Tax=Bacillus atrophaeus TaxID=1452 RepID=UPI002E20F5CB|nr:NAD kinase [Bacillus atrophaeus]MED1030225.1 NAD kinase [Bacillus atrophaeus]MED1118564.1 NAD kinase [Bacillus atrophaeus]MED1132830.1 NAD kinase [Bacillus atrophaeus]